jgi:tryptophan halogenase
VVQPDRIRSIAVLGGGTAGWIAASVLARALAGTDTAITVIESAEIGRIGVGEATIPAILDLLKFLQIDEADFVREVGATYKLGIKFFGWSHPGHTYWHPFGAFGTPIARRPFYHAWQKACADGLNPCFNDFSLCAAMGDELKFRPPDTRTPTPAAGIRYALHFDAHRVAAYLRAYAGRQGVVRLERNVRGATRRDDGFIDEIVFDDGSRLGADLYIDCSGFRGVLIEQALQTGYIPWGRWLPCDRAVAVDSVMASPRTPYTGAFARPAGWRWRIPLQERAGNGYVYASEGVSDDAAFDDLRTELGETLLSPPRFLRFVTGRRRQLWNRNCVALGLASGFIEPLESTNIQLAISGVYNLLDHFPDRNFDPANIAAYNAELIDEVEHVRDFIILHYCLTQRDDTDLWRGVRGMTLPDSLQAKIDLYRGTGRVGAKPRDLFSDVSWFYIFEGMGVRPAAYDPLLDTVPRERLAAILDELASDHAAALTGALSHDSYFSHPIGRRPAPVSADR